MPTASEPTNKDGFRLLAHFLRPSRALLACAAIASTAGALLALGPFVLIYLMALELSAPIPDQDAIANLAIWAVSVFVLRFVCQATGSKLSHVVAYNLLYRLRLAITDKLTRIPLNAVTARTSGDLKKTIMQSVEIIELLVAHHLTDLVASVVVPVCGAVLLFAVDWPLACAAIAVVPLALALQGLLMRDADRMIETHDRTLSAINAASVEFVRGIKTIRAFGRTADTFARLNDAAHAYRTVGVTLADQAMPAWSGFKTLIGAGFVLLVPLGAWRYVTGAIDMPTLVLFLALGLGLTRPLLQLLFFAGLWKRIMVSLRRIAALLALPEFGNQPSAPMPRSHTIQFEEVTFRYGDALVVDRVSFDVAEGTTTALVGPSGAGKTTLAYLLGRFLDPESGRILIGGQDLRELSPERIGSVVSFVFQDVFLLNDSVEANIRMADETADPTDVADAAKIARIHDFVAALPDGYCTNAGEAGARLSGGQRQRLSLARAVLRRSPILVLDEATAFSDPANERGIAQTLAAQTGTTRVIIAHRPEAIRQADQVVFLESGRCVARGPHQELLRSSEPYRVYWQSITAWRNVAAERTHEEEVLW